jgi:hypothetical protein
VNKTDKASDKGGLIGIFFMGFILMYRSHCWNIIS